MILLKLKTMKKLFITSVLAVLVALGTTVMAQENPAEYLGLPGDNLNLYAVMKLFQESQTLEGFEKALNDENSRINNLDLNGDGMIDYITVSDYVDGDVHTIVLRAVLNRNESQDVAVFTVQRFNNGSVQIQLIGDESLYGRNYIIEPIYDDNNGGTINPGYMGRQSNQVNITIVRTSPYEIAAWPLVRFIYYPSYMPWHSSWYWGYYPSFWHPWRPFSWDYYYGYHYYWYNDYYAHFHRWDHYRYPRYNDFYYRGIRSYSPLVGERIRDGRFRDTYSHPEQRREGENLFARTNPGMERRRPDNQGMNNQSGRSLNQGNRDRNFNGNNSRSQRQQGNSINNRSRYSTPSNQNADISRSRSAAPDRSGNRYGQTQRSISSGQSQRNMSRPQQSQRSMPADQTQRSMSRPQQSQRSMPSDQTQRSMSRPQQNQPGMARSERSQRSETVRSSGQSAPRSNSSARSSRQERSSSSGSSSRSSSRSSSGSNSGNRNSKSDRDSRR